MYLQHYQSLYSLLRKKNGKVQNLGAVEFCPLSDCIFDVFAYSPLPTQYRKVQNLRVVKFCQFFSCMYDIFVSSLLPIQSSVKKIWESALSWGSWVLFIFRLHINCFGSAFSESTYALASADLWPAFAQMACAGWEKTKVYIQPCHHVIY